MVMVIEYFLKVRSDLLYVFEVWVLNKFYILNVIWSGFEFGLLLYLIMFCVYLGRFIWFYVEKGKIGCGNSYLFCFWYC